MSRPASTRRTIRRLDKTATARHAFHSSLPHSLTPFQSCPQAHAVSCCTIPSRPIQCSQSASLHIIPFHPTPSHATHLTPPRRRSPVTVGHSPVRSGPGSVGRLASWTVRSIAPTSAAASGRGRRGGPAAARAEDAPQRPVMAIQPRRSSAGHTERDRGAESAAGRVTHTSGAIERRRGTGRRRHQLHAAAHGRRGTSPPPPPAGTDRGQKSLISHLSSQSSLLSPSPSAH